MGDDEDEPKKGKKGEEQDEDRSMERKTPREQRGMAILEMEMYEGMVVQEELESSSHEENTDAVSGRCRPAGLVDPRQSAHHIAPKRR